VAARVLPGYSPAELWSATQPRTPPSRAGVVSFMLYAAALDNGSVTVATAAVVLAETAPPALIGILFLGDHTRPGLALVAWLAFRAGGHLRDSPGPGSGRPERSRRRPADR